MPPEILALIDKPLLLIAVLAVGAVLGIAVERSGPRWKPPETRLHWQKRNWVKRNRQFGSYRKGPRPDPTPHKKFGGVTNLRLVPTPTAAVAARSVMSATDQLACVMDAKFSSRPLLNQSEANLFKALDAAVIARNSRWQVMAQVSLGEFISSTDKDAYGCVNSKRVDFALMDPAARVIHAIEYQGTGHHLEGGAAAARDAVKKEALRKAGIGYHEVVAGHTTAGELRRLVEKLVPGDV